MNDATPLHLQVERATLRAGARPDGRLLLEGASFDVHAGERWVVLGPNGAGKSSLLGALAGVFGVSAGCVRLQRRDLAQWPRAELADWRAWCPQFWVDPFPATVEETVRLARDRRAMWPWRRDADATDATAAADAAEVARVVMRLELDALRDADVRTLSGGERQRVAVATAMLQGARLLLLDEPASHLDLTHQQSLIDLLRDHADAGHAVVASLHDLNLAWELATHAVLIDGRGGWLAGPREDVLTPRTLSDAFGIAVDRVEVCGQQRFWIGPRVRGAR